MSRVVFTVAVEAEDSIFESVVYAFGTKLGELQQETDARVTILTTEADDGSFAYRDEDGEIKGLMM